MKTKKTKLVKMKCDSCGRVRERYPNAKFCYGRDGKICGRLRKLPPTHCPTCGRRWPRKECTSARSKKRVR
jgi:hypothetical protein